MSFDILPMELLQKIFHHCSGTDLRAAAQVCHRWAAAVQQPLERNTCLSVSIRRQFHQPTSRTAFIGKTVLRKSNRQYGALSIEWRDSETNRNRQLLLDLLGICEERFVAVKRLYLRVPPTATLVQFFEDRQSWLKNLVELHVKLEPVSDLVEDTEGIYEMSFPHLREVSWHEYQAEANLGECPGGPLPSASDIYLESCYAFVLNTPELRRLTFAINYCMGRNNLESRLRDTEASCLFLPTLELKTLENLESVTFKGLFRLSERFDFSNERFLQNLRELTFHKCHGSAIMDICEKCTNLKELTIIEPDDGDMALQIADVFSFSLEHLTIRCKDSSLELFGNAEFQKLQSICLNSVDLENDVTLVAPQLTTCDTIRTSLTTLTMPHVEQIHTRKVLFNNDLLETIVPSPNVTELHVHLSSARYWDDGYRLIQNCLAYFLNLRRLVVHGDSSDRLLALLFFEYLNHLESLSAYDVTMRLIDAEKFAGLKTLTLTNCTLEAEPTDGEVSLAALEYVRMHQIAIDGSHGIGESRFPIRVSERQPPIECVTVSPKGLNVFSSKCF